jgi:hypothetical protein
LEKYKTYSNIEIIYLEWEINHINLTL